jgi:hypothetical protein
MNVKDLTEAQLREKADECMEGFETVNSLEKQDKLAEAQFYLSEIDRREQAAERKHTRWIERRDLLLEVVIIGLISWEIHSAQAEGKAQLDVLSKLQLSSAATAETLKDVRKAQEATTSAIQPQVALLEKTRGTLAAQLDIGKRQQGLISRQLELQESALAEQQRTPIAELRAFTRTKKVVTGEYRLMQPGPSGYLGYVARVLGDPRLHEIRLTFLVRNIGTAPILNFKPQVRVPTAAFTIKCVDFGPEMHLLAESPDECSTAIDKIPPIEPVQKGTPVASQPLGSMYPDFVFQALVVGPTDKPQFDISVEINADNLRPIYYRIQCMRLSDMSPYAE